MKLFKLLLSATIAFFAFSFLGTTLTSCVKQTPIHDTTTLIVKDTITIKDTVIINDTLYNLSKGLVGYYNFNGGSLADSSGFGNNITFNNATLTSDRFGNANNAYLFDGNSSYMVVKNSASINPKNITLYAIVKPNGFFQGECHGNQILSKGYPYDINGFYSLSFFAVNNGTGGVCSPTVDTTREIFGGEYGDNYPQGTAAGAGNDSIYVQTNQWFTVIYTYDGTTAKLFEFDSTAI